MTSTLIYCWGFTACISPIATLQVLWLCDKNIFWIRVELYDPEPHLDHLSISFNLSASIDLSTYLSCMMNLGCINSGIVYYPIFTSKLGFVRIMLNFHSIYLSYFYWNKNNGFSNHVPCLYLIIDFKSCFHILFQLLTLIFFLPNPKCWNS